MVVGKRVKIVQYFQGFAQFAAQTDNSLTEVGWVHIKYCTYACTAR
jgi:hypothetical protein